MVVDLLALMGLLVSVGSGLLLTGCSGSLWFVGGVVVMVMWLVFGFGLANV